MADRLAGRVAIVTGAGRGIGRGHALLLAAEGASVVVNDYGGGAGGELDGEAGPADEVVAAIKDAGGKAVANYDSVADMAAGERMVQQALDGFGRLDILVNNAGILRDRMVFNMTEEEWDVVVAVHLKGHFTVTKFASQVFRQQRSGRIVGTSSESGLGNMGQANYAAAKEGIVGLTRTLARDLGRYGVTANAIRPRAGTRLTLTEELAEAQRRAREAGLASGDAGGLAFGGDREAMMAPGKRLAVRGLALHRRRGQRQRPHLPRLGQRDRDVQRAPGRGLDLRHRTVLDARRARPRRRPVLPRQPDQPLAGPGAPDLTPRPQGDSREVRAPWRSSTTNT